MARTAKLESTTFRRVGPVVACPWEGQTLLVPVVDGVADLARIATLDPRAAGLWQELGPDPTVPEVAAALQARGGLPAQATADARAFLGSLVAHGLLAGPAPPPQAPAGAAAAPGELPAPALEALARAVLAQGYRLRFRAHGHSMRPMIADGTLLEVAPRALALVRRGDIVLYSAGPHRLVAHRVLRRRHGALLARGDSAARVDHVDTTGFLGVVVAKQIARGRVALDTQSSRLRGTVASALHRLGRGAIRLLVVAPLRLSVLRHGVRWLLDRVSSSLHRAERKASRLRRRLDVARAALRTTAEKDQERAWLYAGKAVRDFTALDENLAAGLTLLEEALLTRHPLAFGSQVLVLGCGPGRECIALAARGCVVTGADRDPAMLALARAHAERRGADVRLVQADAQSFALAERFDAVVVFSGLYDMVLPRARRVALLGAARAHLHAQGRVFLTFLSDYVPPGRADAPPRPGTLALVNPEHEEGDTYLLNEAVHVFPHPRRLEAEARDAGLRVVEVFRDQRAYDRGPRQVRGFAVLVRDA